MMLPCPPQLKKRRSLPSANDADYPTSEHVVILADDAPAAAAEPTAAAGAELAPAEVTAPAAAVPPAIAASTIYEAPAGIGAVAASGISSQYTCSLGDCN